MAVQMRTAPKKNPVKKTPARKPAAKKSFENNQKKITRASVKRPGSGGARKGSGRKVGAATKKTREIADKLAESSDVTPLAYMLSVLNTTPDNLRKQHENGELDTPQYMVALQDLTKRRDKAAVDSCPYIHPRLSSITADVGLRGHDYWVSLLAEQDL